jgi:hypothetical protein
MKITKSELRKIIQEELSNVLEKSGCPRGHAPGSGEEAQGVACSFMQKYGEDENSWTPEQLREFCILSLTPELSPEAGWTLVTTENLEFTGLFLDSDSCRTSEEGPTVDELYEDHNIDSLNEENCPVCGESLNRTLTEEEQDEREILEDDDVVEEGGKCTKATKKASSTRKGKKWMKCVRSDSGGYKRIHWGQAGVRVGSGSSKRRKSFRARHKCKGAKANTPRGQACKDW